MGIGALIGAVISAVVGVATANKQASLLKKQAQAQKRAQKIQNNKENNKRLAELRQRAKERRVKAAKVAQGAAGTGTANSSAEFGTVGAMSTNVNNQVGVSKGQQVANTAISDQYAKANRYGVKAQMAGLQGQAIQSFAGIFSAFG